MIKRKERGVGGAIEISPHTSTQLPQANIPKQRSMEEKGSVEYKTVSADKIY